MRLGQLMDPLARALLGLRTVSRTQWALRLGGAAATVLALVVTVGGLGLLANAGAVLVTLLVAVSLLAQLWNPDSDLGLLAPGALLVALVIQGETPMLRTAAVGLALLLAHSAFALAATLPVHGEFDRSAWVLVTTALLPVLVVSAVAAAVVVALSGVALGPWMLVLGMLAAIGLFLTVLPRKR